MGFNNDKAVEIYSNKNSLFKEEAIIFQKYLIKPMKILDLGCGTGRTTRYLKDAGHNVVGLDISPLMIEKAQRKHSDIEFIVGDAANLRQQDNSFDVVLFSFNGLDCLYPLENRYKSMMEAYRVLRNGGYFIYSSHDVKTLLSIRGLTRIRLHDYPYFKEHTVYGDLILFYGTINENLRQQRKTGFKSLENVSIDHGWRYYVCQKI